MARHARSAGARHSVNVRIRKLAVEASDNGLLSPELAAGITRIKGTSVCDHRRSSGRAAKLEDPLKFFQLTFVRSDERSSAQKRKGGARSLRACQPCFGISGVLRRCLECPHFDSESSLDRS